MLQNSTISSTTNNGIHEYRFNKHGDFSNDDSQKYFNQIMVSPTKKFMLLETMSPNTQRFYKSAQNFFLSSTATSTTINNVSSTAKDLFNMFANHTKRLTNIHEVEIEMVDSTTTDVDSDTQGLTKMFIKNLNLLNQPQQNELNQQQNMGSQLIPSSYRPQPDQNSSLPMPPFNNRNYQEARYKTELCVHYRESNHCPHGYRCLFAHGLEELRPYRGRHPKHKTQRCKAFHEKGFCNYGYRCSYIHSESPRTIEYIKRLNRRAQIFNRNHLNKFRYNVRRNAH